MMKPYKTIPALIFLSFLFCSSKSDISGTTDEVETGKGIADIHGTITDSCGAPLSDADLYLYTGDSLQQNTLIDSAEANKNGEYLFTVEDTGYYKVKGIYTDSADNQIGYIKPPVHISADTDTTSYNLGSMVITSKPPESYPVHVLTQSDRNTNIEIDQPSCIKFPAANPEDTNVVHHKLKVAKEPNTDINVDVVPLGSDTLNIPSGLWGDFTEIWDHDNDGEITVLIIPYTDITMPFQFDWMP